MAETSRAPFDLTEAESELVAGYQTEYSSMSFALYWLGEYANVILMCALNATLFWGGWLPPLDMPALARTAIAGHRLAVRSRSLVFFFVFSWVKATRAALPLRSADAAGLEDLPAAVAAVRLPRLRVADAHPLPRSLMRMSLGSLRQVLHPLGVREGAMR